MTDSPWIFSDLMSPKPYSTHIFYDTIVLFLVLIVLPSDSRLVQLGRANEAEMLLDARTVRFTT